MTCRLRIRCSRKSYTDPIHAHKHAIQPIQQFAYTTGKNSTDSALIIDAMDLLHSDHFDGFCLVSSDSDFTRLATRLKESGVTVYGFGEAKTTESFVNACDKFVYTEILSPQSEQRAVVQGNELVPPLKTILPQAIEKAAKDSGWSYLAEVGSQLSHTNASFDPRNYGFAKLSDLVRAQPYVEVKDTANETAPGVIYVRLNQTNMTQSIDSENVGNSASVGENGRVRAGSLYRTMIYLNF